MFTQDTQCNSLVDLIREFPHYEIYDEEGRVVILKVGKRADIYRKK